MVIRVLQGSRLDFGPRPEQIPEVRTRIPALQNIPTTSKSATALAQLGQDISASGIQLARVGAINQARDEDREAQAREVAVTQEIRDLERELLAKPGQSALDFEPEYNRRLDEIINTQAGSASNEAVANNLSKRLSAVRERALNKAGGHFVKARTDAEAATDLLERQILMESLGDDPLNEELLKKFAFLNAKELNRKGIKDKELRTWAQKVALSSLYKDIITNYIDEGRVAEADALFKTAFVVGNLIDKDKADVSAKLRLRTVDLRARQNLLQLTLALPDGSETEYNKEADKLSPDDAKAVKDLIKDDFVVRRRQKTEAVDAVKEKLRTQIENGEPLNLTSDEEVLADKHGLLSTYKGIQRNIKSGALLSPDLSVLAEIQTAKENGTFKDIDLFQKDGRYSKGLGKEFIKTLKEQLAAKALVMTDSKAKEKELKDRRKEVLDLSRMSTFNTEMKDALATLGFTSSQLADVKLVASRLMHDEAQRDPTRIGFTNQEMNSILQQAAAEVRVRDTGLFGFFQTEQLLATSILNGDPVTAESLEPVTQRILKELPSPFKVGANATSDQKTAAAAATQKYNNDIHNVVNHLVQNKILPTPITVKNFLLYQRKKVATIRAARLRTFPEAATDVFHEPGLQRRLVPESKLGPLGTEVVGETADGRPIIKNPDGSFSSERSATRETAQGFINFPTIFDKKQLSEDEAFDIVEAAGFTDPETGRKLEFFQTQAEAVAAAVARSANIMAPSVAPPTAPPVAAVAPVSTVPVTKADLEPADIEEAQAKALEILETRKGKVTQAQIDLEIERQEDRIVRDKEIVRKDALPKLPLPSKAISPLRGEFDVPKPETPAETEARRAKIRAKAAEIRKRLIKKKVPKKEKVEPLQALREAILEKEVSRDPIKFAEVSPDDTPEMKELIPTINAFDTGLRNAAGKGKTVVSRNNPGNIRATTIPWDGKTGSKDGFETFDTPENGARAVGKLLQTYQSKYGLNTIEGIINRYAPASENPTKEYIKFVVNKTGIAADKKISTTKQDTLNRIVVAMIRFEGAKPSVPASKILKGIAKLF